MSPESFQGQASIDPRQRTHSRHPLILSRHHGWVRNAPVSNDGEVRKDSEPPGTYHRCQREEPQLGRVIEEAFPSENQEQEDIDGTGEVEH